MDNKHRKLFVIKQSEWCKFVHKMHQNTFFSARTRCRIPPSRIGGRLLRFGRKKEGRGEAYV